MDTDLSTTKHKFGTQLEVDRQGMISEVWWVTMEGEQRERDSGCFCVCLVNALPLSITTVDLVSLDHSSRLSGHVFLFSVHIVTQAHFVGDHPIDTHV